MKTKAKHLYALAILRRFIKGFIATFLPLFAAALQSQEFNEQVLMSLLLSACSCGILSIDTSLKDHVWYHKLGG